MGARGLGALLLLALLGAGGGYAVAHAREPHVATFRLARPVPASDPSLPVDPVRPYAPDITYPALQPDLAYHRQVLGQPGYQQWVYRVPKGWRPTIENGDPNEIRWRPADEPEIGGYSLRVKLVFEHKTKQQMVDQKLAAMQAGYQDVEILGQPLDTLSFSYRDSARNTLRFNTFRWFSLPGTEEATFEMSVVGRAVDRAGLDDLLAEVARRVAPVQ
ncbi:MAG: hypothetical protein ACXVWZ_09380 [Nocardioides sp.]